MVCATPPPWGGEGGEGALFINKAATLYYYKIGGLFYFMFYFMFYHKFFGAFS